MRLDASQHYLGELTGAAAPFRYEGCVRRGILHTKYHAAPWAAVELGLWLAKLAFGSEMHMAGAEPVPELIKVTFRTCLMIFICISVQGMSQCINGTYIYCVFSCLTYKVYCKPKSSL